MCVCVCVWGGGVSQVTFIVVSREGGGSMYLHLVSRAVIQNLDNVSKF